MPSDRVTEAVVLAGGLGTRLRSTVPDVPKPMAPVEGRPFLEYLLDYWIGQGVESFVLSVGYLHEVISDHFGSRYRDARIRYSVEETPLGTGGGALLAAGALGSASPFLLLNGDTFFEVDLAQLAAFARESDADWCFSLFRAAEAGRYMGMQVEEDGRITALRSNTQDIGRLANGGVYLVHPRSLASLGLRPGDKLSLEDEVFAKAMASGQRFFGLEFRETFIDIGVPADYHRAAALLRR